jgi:hypothetical protein
MLPDPVIILTVELRKPGILALYKNMGYTYIRQVHRPYNAILRSPSVGCIVELTPWKYAGSHAINSSKARRLICRMSYFGYL